MKRRRRRTEVRKEKKKIKSEGSYLGGGLGGVSRAHGHGSGAKAHQQPDFKQEPFSVSRCRAGKRVPHVAHDAQHRAHNQHVLSLIIMIDGRSVGWLVGERGGGVIREN